MIFKPEVVARNGTYGVRKRTLRGYRFYDGDLNLVKDGQFHPIWSYSDACERMEKVLNPPKWKPATPPLVINGDDEDTVGPALGLQNPSANGATSIVDWANGGISWTGSAAQNAVAAWSAENQLQVTGTSNNAVPG